VTLREDQFRYTPQTKRTAAKRQLHILKSVPNCSYYIFIGSNYSVLYNVLHTTLYTTTFDPPLSVSIYWSRPPTGDTVIGIESLTVTDGTLTV
jgi:hypothetical protein